MLTSIAVNAANNVIVLAAPKKTTGAQINLAGGWDKFWNAVTGGFPTLTVVLTTVGVILVVWALTKWAWDRRRGGGGNAQPLWGALIIGGIFAAPGVLMPLALKALDFVANSVLKIVQATL